MRTTVSIDDELYEKAFDLSGQSLKGNKLFEEAIKTYIRVESAKRLAALGGAAPNMKDIPRR
jgi:predicted CopG family antitoxin